MLRAISEVNSFGTTVRFESKEKGRAVLFFWVGSFFDPPGFISTVRCSAICVTVTEIEIEQEAPESLNLKR